MVALLAFRSLFYIFGIAYLSPIILCFPVALAVLVYDIVLRAQVQRAIIDVVNPSSSAEFEASEYGNRTSFHEFASGTNPGIPHQALSY